MWHRLTPLQISDRLHGQNRLKRDEFGHHEWRLMAPAMGRYSCSRKTDSWDIAVSSEDYEIGISCHKVADQTQQKAMQRVETNTGFPMGLSCTAIPITGLGKERKTWKNTAWGRITSHLVSATRRTMPADKDLKSERVSILLKTENEDMVKVCQNHHVQVIIDLLQDGMNTVLTANNAGPMGSH